MLDFMTVAYRPTKRGVIEVYPKFILDKSNDLMIRGRDFYAIWDEESRTWSREEHDAIRIIDKALDDYVSKNKDKFEGSVHVLHMWDAESGTIDAWHKFCQKQKRDEYHELDAKLIFQNDKQSKRDYSSKRLPYSLENGSYESYDRLMSTLYSEEERHKLEWMIGSVINGDSKKIQKFMVLYGSAGTGKSTVLNIIQKLFEGYWVAFESKALGSANASFAFAPFETNPLVAIEHDGDLSRIEDNSRINSLVSHETIIVNKKFQAAYPMRPNSILFIGTNRPVKITDAKSGLLRRLIDVHPTGNKIPAKEYHALMKRIDFELGSIAWHCKEVYEADPGYYDDYAPEGMIEETNDFYNFIEDNKEVFEENDGIALASAWALYKNYCEETRMKYPFSYRVFKAELRNYFEEFIESRYLLQDGTRPRNYYKGFLGDKFKKKGTKKKIKKSGIEFKEQESIFDKEYSACKAQYANEEGTPLKKWNNVRTTLSALDTSKLHYVKMDNPNHIVIDFDIKDSSGEKSYDLNMKEASKWPPTYSELSKSGKGIHLHYIYNGDVSKLSRIYSPEIEVKVFQGNSSLRRRLTKCNDLPIATISSGLPLKGEAKVVNPDVIKNEKGVRTLIEKNLRKEIHSSTKCSIDFIEEILKQAYESGMHYDVSDMYNSVLTFAMNSSNQSRACVKAVSRMKFCSDDISDAVSNYASDTLIFYDVEVFPNLFLVCFKAEGPDKKVIRMINPTPEAISELIKFKLVGFNCRKYDNHMLYARLMGRSVEEIYELSQSIIEKKTGFYGEAYNLSYTDILDFSSKKQSLKKFEIELGIHHQELGLPWDQPVPENMWEKVASYCDNDVIATEAVFNARKSDFLAREILADVAGMTVNDTTNSLTTRIIFGSNKRPQGVFNYRDMGDETQAVGEDIPFIWERFDAKGRPIFPGYKYEFGKSTYRGEEVGEGGYVYSEPGMYSDIALLDIASMHPSSIIAEQLFGPEFTKRFQEIRDARIAIKHGDFDLARTMLDGKLAKYLDDESVAKDLAQALKIAINSVYGLTSAGFSNPFRDPRNIDNIVAKRGALFMVNLKHAVQEKGFKVAHIKTDSIKIPNATPEIIQFVMDYGQRYGYTFEHEATYSKMCLVNDAVYIAKYKDGKHAGEWTATGTQFQVPYVFKTLFSKEPIVFDDLCETKSVTTSIYLDMNENINIIPGIDVELDRRKRGVKKLDPNFAGYSDDELVQMEKNNHCYVFVGKVGQFCPMLPGCGAGYLMREKDGKYYAVTGSKGYKWMESEMVKTLKLESFIDRSYYDNLVNEAVTDISQYGDFEWFTS